MKIELIWISILVYIVWGTIIAVLSRRGAGKGVVDYFLANRKLKDSVSSLSYSATTYSAFMMLGLVGLAYKGGVGALGFELIYLSGLVLAVFFGPMFWRAGSHYNCISPAELLSVRYHHKTVGAASAFISLIFLIPYSAVQLMGIGYLLETLSRGKISFVVGVLIATLITWVWTEVAGLRSIATTDSLQAGIMLVSSLILIYVLVYRFLGGPGAFIHTVETTYPQWLMVPGNGYFRFQTFLGLSLPWFFFSISNPQVSQRLFVPASLPKMRKMIGGFLGYGFLYTLITIVLGFCTLVLFPGLTNPDQATPTLLSRLSLPPLIVLLVTVGIFSAAISTIDSVFLTISSMFVRDILRVKKEVEENKQIVVAQIFITILCVTSFLFALMRFNLIAILSVASSAGLLSIVPATVGAFLWKRGNKEGALCSMIGGAGLSFLLQMTGWKPWGFWPGVWTLIVSTILYFGVSRLTPESSNDDFFHTIKGK
ncbi:MAG: sodium:solute symporter family protein [Atribacterota bacterium]